MTNSNFYKTLFLFYSLFSPKFSNFFSERLIYVKAVLRGIKILVKKSGGKKSVDMQKAM